MKEKKIDIEKTAAAYDSVSEKGIEEATEKLVKKEAIEEAEVVAEGSLNNEREKIIRSRKDRDRIDKEKKLASWIPKTKLGKDVKEGKITNIEEVLNENKKILEDEIVDILIPKLEHDLISIGQSKGKFGGGKRRAWRQTQRKKKEGNVATFSTMAVIGDSNGHLGIGSGRAKETLPARDKAIRQAKLSIIRVKRTCAAFDCSCSELHTVPFEINGRSGSVRVKLIPAPQGTGLVVADQLKKILSLAGIKDVYSRTSGKQRTTFNLAKACIQALKQTTKENDSNN